jgi:hypothetical protein
MRIFLTIGLTVTLIFVLGVLSFYASDWRLDTSWNFVKTGSLEIAGVAGAQIFIDEKRVSVQSENGILVAHKVLPGSHSVLVASDKKWPWTKSVSVQEDSSITIHPFLIEQSPTARVLQEHDPEYFDAQHALRSITLPSPSTPLTSSDGTIDLYVRDTILGAVWRGPASSTPKMFCEDSVCGPIEILNTRQGNIRGISFLSERNDAVLVAVSNGIFALDLDPAEIKNFQPLYRGVTPTFARRDAHSIYKMVLSSFC